MKNRLPLPEPCRAIWVDCGCFRCRPIVIHPAVQARPRRRWDTPIWIVAICATSGWAVSTTPLWWLKLLGAFAAVWGVGCTLMAHRVRGRWRLPPTTRALGSLPHWENAYTVPSLDVVEPVHVTCGQSLSRCRCNQHAYRSKY